MLTVSGAEFQGWAELRDKPKSPQVQEGYESRVEERRNRLRWSVEWCAFGFKM